MRNLWQAEIYYLRKDLAFKSVTAVFALASFVLVLILGSNGGYALRSYAEPLKSAASFSILFYLVIPLHACFFATEGFEHGSVQNIIAAGHSRMKYFTSKYVLELLAALGWLLEFYGLFYLFYLAAALITGAPMGHAGFTADLMASMTALGLNLLYLAAYCAAVMMLGMLIRKPASAVVAAFFFIFGNLLLSGYLKDSSSAVLRVISEYSLMTQILKFSGIYVAQARLVLLSDAGDYIRAVLIPVIWIAVCLSAALLALENKDIHI
ncbi:ABC transporter permease [Paenibacillus tritici]|uniref:ABC transporter permease n=1 Tax=Paenibacillus tritici TaxID=1873425 RepID=UPI001BA66A10|nr:ABC transporter permease [Paenibacillus tritici]QUL55970.1 ABC transporter permease [Paenibacillus tritici]